jgi:Na+/H+ antiporter NhaA
MMLRSGVHPRFAGVPVALTVPLRRWEDALEFTMSTFIATLGFDSLAIHLQSAKSSILVAWLISAILGILYLRFIAAKKLAHVTQSNFSL